MKKSPALLSEFDIDCMDVRESFNTKQMLKIYLKTPFKVLNAEQIKKKDIDGKLKFYQAENNLDLHTQFRKKNIKSQI